MRFVLSMLVVIMCDFSYGQQNICTGRIEQESEEKILPSARITDPVEIYVGSGRFNELYFDSQRRNIYYRTFHRDAHLYTQVITCGTIKNITLPLTLPEKLSTCDYCSEITLEFKYLNGEVVPESAFSQLESITDIHLDNLGIKYVSPGAFQGMTSLRTIYLSNNNISRIHAGVFNNEKLTFLDLSYNNMMNVSNQMLLEKKIFPITLNLSHNHIDYLKSELFLTVFFNLSSLDLSYNKISTLDIRYITSNISYLDLSHNGLLSILVCFNTIPKLILSHNSIRNLENKCSDTSLSMKYLDLSHNKLTEINSETFTPYLGMETLFLQSNSIRNISIGAFSHMAYLQNLNLSYNSIPSLPSGSFENFGSLKILDLSNNLLKRLDFNTLHRLPALTDLYIQNNMMVDFKYEELLNAFPKLRLINMDNNNFTCDNLMETVFYLETKAVGIAYGTTKYEENIFGMACPAKRRKLYQEQHANKTGQSDTVEFVEEIASYYQQISMFWVTIVVLILLLLILTYQTYMLYYKCHFIRLENVEMM